MFAPRLALLTALLAGWTTSSVVAQPDSNTNIDSQEGIQAIELALTDRADPERLIAELDKIAAEPFVPEALFETLDGLINAEEPGVRLAAIRAMGSVRSRDAVIRLFSLTTPDRSAADRDAAFAALARLTGRVDLGSDRRRWGTFVDQVRSMPTSRWRRLLVQGLSVQADLLSERTESAETRLARTTRELYLAKPESQRSAMLAEMLADPVPAVLTLAIDLASRAFSAGATLSEDAVLSLVELLKHESPQHRADAALLLARVGDPMAAPAILEALENEQAEIAAQALLIAASRSPSPELLEPTLRWIWPMRTRRAAAEAAWAVARNNQTTPAMRAQLKDVLADIPVDDLPPAGMRARILLGDDVDWREVATQLTSADLTRRTAAAEALAISPGATRHLLAAAVDDPTLFIPATEALARHHPTIEGFRMLLTLPSDKPRDETLQDFSRKLSVDDLVIAANAEEIDAALRARMLNRLMTEPATEATARTHAMGLAALAESRLAVQDDAGALTALTRLRDVDRTFASSPRVSRTLLAALLATDRFDETAEIQAPPIAWLEAVIRLRDRELRARALSFIAPRIPQDDSPIARAYNILRDAIALRTPPVTPENDDTGRSAENSGGVMPPDGNEANADDAGASRP